MRGSVLSKSFSPFHSSSQYLVIALPDLSIDWYWQNLRIRIWENSSGRASQ